MSSIRIDLTVSQFLNVPDFSCKRTPLSFTWKRRCLNFSKALMIELFLRILSLLLLATSSFSAFLLIVSFHMTTNGRQYFYLDCFVSFTSTFLRGSCIISIKMVFYHFLWHFTSSYFLSFFQTIFGNTGDLICSVTKSCSFQQICKIAKTSKCQKLSELRNVAKFC